MIAVESCVSGWQIVCLEIPSSFIVQRHFSIGRRRLGENVHPRRVLIGRFVLSLEFPLTNGWARLCRPCLGTVVNTRAKYNSKNHVSRLPLATIQFAITYTPFLHQTNSSMIISHVCHRQKYSVLNKIKNPVRLCFMFISDKIQCVK